MTQLQEAYIVAVTRTLWVKHPRRFKSTRPDDLLANDSRRIGASADTGSETDRRRTLAVRFHKPTRLEHGAYERVVRRFAALVGA